MLAGPGWVARRRALAPAAYPEYLSRGMDKGEKSSVFAGSNLGGLRSSVRCAEMSRLESGERKSKQLLC